MTSIETLDSEITRLQAELVAVQSAGPVFAERWPAVEAELQEAEQVFRELGSLTSGFQSVRPIDVHRARLALFGAAIVAGRQAITDSEKARIKAATATGVSQADKVTRTTQLSAAILKLAARKELALREIETDDQFEARPVHAELFLATRPELERLAA